MASVIERQARPPIWRDVRILKWIAQFAVLGGVLFVLWLLASTATGNLGDQGKTISFDFLSKPVGITLSEGSYVTVPDSALQALTVGVVNMFRLTFSGIIAATVLGTILGVARLSHNWIVNKAATGYIETVRNIPLLVQIFFWLIIIRLFGQLTTESGISLPFMERDFFYYSAKGFALPWFNPTETRWQWVAFFVVGILATVLVYRWRIRIQESGRGEAKVGIYSIGTLVLFAVAGWWLHPIMGFLGWIFGSIEWVFATLPVLVFQVLLALLVLYGGYWVIKARLDSLRTPNGYGKFSDDDWYRIITAGLMALIVAVFLFAVPAVTEAIIGRADVFGKASGFERLFGAAADRFEFMRGGAPFDPNLPVLTEGTFVNYDSSCGKVVTISYAALWGALVIYTAAFVGEAVRAGVMAVSKGQTEAGLAVGLKRSQLLRMIVLPQAFRIVLPPIGNQYLNLAKNTSLAIATGFSDVVAVGSTIYNQTGAVLPIFLFWMVFYSLVSLGLSSVVNYWNNRLKLVER